MMQSENFPITGKDIICKNIVDALGFKKDRRIKSLQLNMDVSEIVTVTIKFYPSKEEMRKLFDELKKLEIVEETFRLKRRPEKKNKLRSIEIEE